MSDNLPKPTAFTPAAQAVIVEAIAKGNYLSTACARAGVTYSAFTYWRRLVEKGDPNAAPFVDFFAAVKKAGAAAECNALDNLREGMSGWQAQAWFLERRFPSRWGKQDRADVSPRVVTNMSNEELESIVEGKGRGRT